MGCRFSRIVLMRTATLAAMRWLGIHTPAPIVSIGKLTLNPLQFGHRLRAHPAAGEAKIICGFRTLGRIMAKAGDGTVY
jgi:hypothetical protein